MTLTLPRHVEDSGLVARPVAFKWDDDDPWACEFEVPRLDNNLSALCSRANFAFAVANAEWVVWILSKGEPGLYLDFIEACWAAVIDRRYLRHVSRKFAHRIADHYRISPKAGTVEDLWKRDDLADPVRGPQLVALHLLERVADLTAPDDAGTMETVYLCNLVDQVTKKNAAYKAWCRAILVQLQDQYGLQESDEDDLLGAPVPREALVPDRRYRAGQGPALLQAFLQGLDPARNPFLTPAAEMKKLGFDGVPYTL